MTRSSFRFLTAPPAGLLFVIAILMLAAESNRVNAVVGDIDDDGVPDAVDNCPTVANPTQANTDIPQDSKGDACDLIVRTVPWKGSQAATRRFSWAGAASKKPWRRQRRSARIRIRWLKPLATPKPASRSWR